MASDLKQDLPDDERLSDMVMAHNEGILEYQTQLSLLPPVNSQEPKWIPVSERLPEAGKQYLCCDVNGFREVGYLSKTLSEWEFLDSEAFGEVIAWMPLPKPYKAESEEK